MSLIDILSHRRPHGSETEQQFCDKYLSKFNQDEFGNYWTRIGTTETMWSCHTDTVSKEGGMQQLEFKNGLLGLKDGKPGQSLGADDGAGLWLMLELIKNNKPGLYVFHRGEECGGLGSSWISTKNAGFLTGIKRAIAFDRRGTGDVITHQRCSRTASDAFATELAKRLCEQGLNYKPSDEGIFTDTANYDTDIPECTNLSVGYVGEHGPKEVLDVGHLYQLRDAVLAIEFEDLPTERDPLVVDTIYTSYYGSNVKAWTPARTLENVVRERPHALAQYLASQGMTAKSLDNALDDFMDQSWGMTGRSYLDEDDLVEVLWCEECWRDYEVEQPRDGDPCPSCKSVNTYVDEIDPSWLSSNAA